MGYPSAKPVTFKKQKRTKGAVIDPKRFTYSEGGKPITRIAETPKQKFRKKLKGIKKIELQKRKSPKPTIQKVIGSQPKFKKVTKKQRETFATQLPEDDFMPVGEIGPPPDDFDFGFKPKKMKKRGGYFEL
jgi:hypothetical protein